MKRSYISLKTKLAAALLAIKQVDQDGAVSLIHYADAKLMTADQIISLFAFDHHPIRKADGGPDEPWNLTPRLISEHREKTAKIDVPEMAKSKRIRGKEAAHKVSMESVRLASMAANATINEAVDRTLRRMQGKWPARKLPSRPFPKIKHRFANKRGNKI